MDVQAGQETLPLSDQGSALNIVSEEDNVPEDALGQFVDVSEFSDNEPVNMRAKMDRCSRAVQSGLPKISCDVLSTHKRQLEHDYQDLDSDSSTDMEAEDECHPRKISRKHLIFFISETEPEFATLHGSLLKVIRS